MLILVGLVPAAFAAQHAAHDAAQWKTTAERTPSGGRLPDALLGQRRATTVGTEDAVAELTRYDKADGQPTGHTYAALVSVAKDVGDRVENLDSVKSLASNERNDLRTDIYLLAEVFGKLIKGKRVEDPATVKTISAAAADLNDIVKYIPVWVKIAVALALGLGTMIGWKRIVVTVGEKIGKSHLTYAQGASAEMMAAVTIGLADYMGLPVSTTHVLSSGIAGTMAANRSGLQKDTLASILLAWVLTLPVCIFLGAVLFSFGLYLTFHVFGI